jgi:hypothetical protein
VKSYVLLHHAVPTKHNHPRTHLRLLCRCLHQGAPAAQ